MAWFLSRNYWSLLDHDLMASNLEKAISILSGNLNSGRSYLIAAVFEVVKSVISLTYLYHILLVCKKALKSALFMFCPMQKKNLRKNDLYIQNFFLFKPYFVNCSL